MAAVISFVGKSGSGKTSYLEKLVGEMKWRGYKVGVIKHDIHDFEIDKPGKDTWRHFQAGADTVCISSPRKLAFIKKVDKELPLAEVAGYIDGVDIIFTEGYKQEGVFKVEVFRRAVCENPVCFGEDLLAMVTDTVIYDHVPRFGFSDIQNMADFLEERFIRRCGG